MRKQCKILAFPLLLIAIAIGILKYEKKVRSPVVEVLTGKLSGFQQISRGGKEFHSYLGIPFARPPTGDLRFQPPHAPENWVGERDATSFGAMCMQVDNMSWKVTGKEDCLFVNVFSPKDRNSGLLPVVVYIHGGYFMTGGSHNHNPHYIMDEPIVFVTFNYRLGLLGFLSTNDAKIVGNMGLKDQAFALRWVRDNIRGFGGDPDRVTLLGESAGASSVHFLMLSPLAKGLFHKSISQSGTAIKLWSIASKPQEQALRLGRRMNCPVNSSALLRNCLKEIEADTLIETQIETITPLLNPLHMYGPTVEVLGSNSKEKVFLPDHPYTLMSQGKFHKVPWITGINSHEGLLLTARIAMEPNLVAELENNWESVLPQYLLYPPEDLKVTEKIASFYLKSRLGEKLDFEEKYKALTDLMTDRLYLVATREAAIQHASKSPVFLYYYKYQGEQSFTIFFGMKPYVPVTLQFAWKLLSRYLLRTFGLANDDIGVCHGDELFLFFKVPFMEVNVDSKDYELSKSLISLWAKFAYDENDLLVNGSMWKPVPSTILPSTKLNYLTFESSRNHSIKEEEFTERVEFWKSLNLPWIL